VNAYRAANNLVAVNDIACSGFLAFDLQFSKSVELGGARKLEGIFQAFNLFNRSNYLPAVGNALSPSFGQSLQVASPRQMEVALRLSF
jgi:hypothetical protein